ncbi:MAG: ATP-binding cassette domain-containing protein [Prolixibacteraceae bacterium]|nr:ATP-binding cassette domain-containing protein [Prolixibacteraceae bacterium]
MSISVNHITKKYGSQLALNDVSFSVEAGEIVGLLGANGAGKSTLMKILTGYMPPDSGRATICGLPVELKNTGFRKRIGYLPENNPLYHEMYVREYLNMVAGIYKLKNKGERVEEIIGLTGLIAEVSKRIGTLSKGYRQRVGLAQALIHDPEVLILDEPTSGLDPNQLDDIRSLIKNLSTKKTVILSTHILQEVEAICTRVVIIRKGKIVADGPTSEMKKQSKSAQQIVKVKMLGEIEHQKISALPFVSDVKVTPEKEFLVTASKPGDDIRPKLFEAAVKNSWTILSMQEEISSVESVFRDLTK